MRVLFCAFLFTFFIDFGSMWDRCRVGNDVGWGGEKTIDMWWWW